MTSVQRLWSGETVVCIASGPSLTPDDVNYVRGKARAIAINTSYKLAPWADCLYACDARWWKWHDGAKDFPGLKYSLNPHANQALQKRYPAMDGVLLLKNTGQTGLEKRPVGLRTGHNSGYQAINLAVHFGAKRILLLGYDLKRGRDGKVHWHSDHPQGVGVPLALFRPPFQTLVQPLGELGISVINCSRETALTCFPRADLRAALPDPIALERAS